LKYIFEEIEMNKINAVYVSLVALVLAIVALVMCIICCSSEKGGVDVATALKSDPKLVFDAMQAYEAKQKEDALKAVEDKIKDSAGELYNRAADGVIANPNGKKVLVEFFDFSCGYCHRVYPALKEISAKNPDVKIVAKPMTFLSPASKYAAEIALAAAEQGKFAEVYSGVFETEGRLDEGKIDAVAEKLGLDMEKLKADAKSEKVQGTLNAVSSLAGKLQINGVPTLVFNNKILQTLDASVIQQAIDEAK
jgi:protein-disulfide isomerase